MLILFNFDKFPEVGWLDHIVDPFWDFWRISTLSSIMVLLVYISISTALDFFPNILTSIYCFLIFQMIAILTGVLQAKTQVI